MGYEHTSEKLLSLSRNAQCIEINAQLSHKDTKTDTITLDYFLTILQSNCLNENDIELNKISTLNLSHCQLTDLPLSIQRLNLRSLTLSHNELSNVPLCLYNGLENLEYLDIGYNLIEYFDLQPACLANIKVVKINNNLLSTLPKWIINFQSVNLEELNSSYNKVISYKYPKNNYRMHIMKLNKLKLKNSHLLDVDFDFLKCFQNLEYLDISNKGNKSINKIHDADNLFLNLKWKRLKKLKMKNLSISLFPEGITWIETLTELYINQNCISWLPSGMEFMVNLQVIDISENSLIAIPEDITKLEYLEVIIAFTNKIEICPDFSKMVSLKVLDLFDNLLECITINCDNLESLDIEYNYLDTNEFINYNIKKNKLRLQYKTTKRCDWQKTKSCSHDELDDISSDDDVHKYTVDQSQVGTIIDENEDWDSPVAVKTRNPEIDSADEEWNGYEKVVQKYSKKLKEKVYVKDEDWMFEDVID